MGIFKKCILQSVFVNYVTFGTGKFTKKVRKMSSVCVQRNRYIVYICRSGGERSTRKKIELGGRAFWLCLQTDFKCVYLLENVFFLLININTTVTRLE